MYAIFHKEDEWTTHKKWNMRGRFLQKEVESEFPYPFQILTEEDSFLFCFKNGRRDCCARLKATKGMLDRLCSGDKKVQKQEKERMLRVLEAAVEAQENTALSEKSEYGKNEKYADSSSAQSGFLPKRACKRAVYPHRGCSAGAVLRFISSGRRLFYDEGVPGSGSEMDGPEAEVMRRRWSIRAFCIRRGCIRSSA